MANNIPTAFDPTSQAPDAEPCQTSSGLCRAGSDRSVTPNQAEQADDLQGNPRVTTTMLADLLCYETSTIVSSLFAEAGPPGQVVETFVCILQAVKSLQRPTKLTSAQAHRKLTKIATRYANLVGD